MRRNEKRADLYRASDEFEPLEFRVTGEWNVQFQEALQAYYPRYASETEFSPPLVVPGLLIANSNVTRSPGFKLDPGMAAVHVMEEVQYINPGRAGKKFRVTWKVVDFYEKRGRPYQVKEALIVDEDGVKIIRRRMTDTYVGGPYKGIGETASTNDHTGITPTHFPINDARDQKKGDNISITKDTPEGSEFEIKIKTVSLERINLFSGGFPKGPNWPARNIHTDLETAIKCGLKSRAASGAMSEGYLTDLMIDVFGMDWLNCGTMKLAFIRIVDKDEILIPKGVVKSKEVSCSRIEFTMELWCENQFGKRVVSGSGTGSVG